MLPGSLKVLSFEALLKSIMKVYTLEKALYQSDERKRKLFTKKWKTIQQIYKTLREHEVSNL